MSVFMVSMPVGRLERQAAGVEGDPLAHQGQMGDPAVDLDGVGWAVVDPDQPGRLGRAPGHPEQSTELLGDDPVLVPDLDGQLVHPGEALGRRSRRRRSGVSELGGSLTRSRARLTDSAKRAPPPQPGGHRRIGVRDGRGPRPRAQPLGFARRCGSRRTGRRRATAPSATAEATGLDGDRRTRREGAARPPSPGPRPGRRRPRPAGATRGRAPPSCAVGRPPRPGLDVGPGVPPSRRTQRTAWPPERRGSGRPCR